MLDQFSRLISPISPEVFFEQYWASENLHLRRGDSGWYDAILKLADLDAFLQSGLLPAAFVDVYLNGSRVPVEDWSKGVESPRGMERVVICGLLLELYSRGATLVLNAVHQTLPSLAYLCRRLARELGYRAQANVYITPPNSQGFHRHKDDHEVLVLQITGSKSWLLYPANAAALSVDLLAGDLLYVPRCLEHHAQTSSSPSVHIALGLLPTYAFQLVEELAAVAREHPDFQYPVPPRFASAVIKRSAQQRFAGNLQALVSETPCKTLIDRQLHSLALKQGTGWPNRLFEMLYAPELNLDSVVCARPEAMTITEDQGKFLGVTFGAGKTSFPRFLKPCLDRILDPSPFAIRELQGLLSDTGKVHLVKTLVVSGLLSIMKL